MLKPVPDQRMPVYYIAPSLGITDKWDSLQIESRWYCTIPFFECTRRHDPETDSYCLRPVTSVLDWFEKSEIPIKMVFLTVNGERTTNYGYKLIALEFDSPEYIAAIHLFWK